MSIDLTIRQLLACLNVSVFDPLMEPALKSAAVVQEERDDSRNAIFLCIGMFVAAFLCFLALRPYSLQAGGTLFLICGVLLKKTACFPVRVLAKTYFLSALLLLGERLFSYSPLAAVSVLVFFFFRSLFSEKDGLFRVLISVVLFIGTCVAFKNESVFFAGFFSMVGTAGLLFPVKKAYVKEAGTVFSLLPLLFLLMNDVYLLQNAGVVRGYLVFPAAFMADFLLLVFLLRRDSDAAELIRLLAGAFVLFLCGFFLSAGIQGATVLFSLAYFTDSPKLGITAVVLFGLFLLVLLLSLQISLFVAGMTALCVAAFFEYLYFRLRRIGQ